MGPIPHRPRRRAGRHAEHRFGLAIAALAVLLTIASLGLLAAPAAARPAAARIHADPARPPVEYTDGRHLAEQATAYKGPPTAAPRRIAVMPPASPPRPLRPHEQRTECVAVAVRGPEPVRRAIWAPFTGVRNGGTWSQVSEISIVVVLIPEGMDPVDR